MCALHCSGYYHDESRQAFGILFNIPRSISTESDLVQPTTLHQLLADTAHNMKLWPDLDDRFRLAFALAKSVLEFHMIGWLHKSLTALNVAFFPKNRASRDEQVKEPYIIGFNYSRPDDPSAFTEGIISSGAIGYQHPRYRQDTRGYRPEYDYYSLGIILMQIGFWQPLNKIVKLSSDTYDQNLKNRIPQLRQHMGRDYCDAVAACINGDFSPSNPESDKGGNKGIFIDFESQVLNRLNRPPI
jgi:hypothetical protein